MNFMQMIRKIFCNNVVDFIRINATKMEVFWKPRFEFLIINQLKIVIFVHPLLFYFLIFKSNKTKKKSEFSFTFFLNFKF